MGKNFIDNKVDYFIVSFIEYLRKTNIDIPSTVSMDIKKMFSNINILDFNELSEIMKHIICKDKLLYDSYNKLFYSFIEEFFNKELFEEEKTNKINTLKSEKEKMEIKFKEEEEKFIKENYKSSSDIIKEYSKKENKPSLFKNKKLLKNFSNEDYNELSKLSKNISDKTLKNLLLEGTVNNDIIDYEIPAKELNELMINNIKTFNNQKINDLLINVPNIIKNWKDIFNAKEKEYNKKLSALQEQQKNKLSNIQSELSKLSQGTFKFDTLCHREEYIKGYNAVQVLNNIEDIKISNLKGVKYSSLLDYIRINAPKFRTKISRSMKQSKHKVFDYKRTMDCSRKYNGLPLELKYKKPIVKKYKLFCILDISGSVSKYLELLISFIYEISIVFNGGINIFGFVSDLANYTDDFKNYDMKSVIEKLSGHRGYSNYNKGINDFWNNYEKSIDSNTVILFFGDARNNKNPSATNIINKISDKCRSIIWLNPEEEEKWNQGDSIIGLYEPFVKKIYPVSNVKGLINFLENIEI